MLDDFAKPLNIMSPSFEKLHALSEREATPRGNSKQP